MVNSFWTALCGKSDCLCNGKEECTNNVGLMNPSSCINHMFITSVDILLLFMFLLHYMYKPTSRTIHISSHFQSFSPLQIISFIFNGGLGLFYLGLGAWILEEKIRKEQILLPLHCGLVVLLHGFTWILLGSTLSLRRTLDKETLVRIWSILASLFAGFLCVSSLLDAIVHKEVSVKIVLNALSLLGGTLILICTFKRRKYDENGQTNDGGALYTPLNGEDNANGTINSDGYATPFAKAGFFSRMSFWWLNPLMKKGSKKILEEEDIPQLREVDRAETCYLLFMEQFNKQKCSMQSTTPSILWTIVLCHWKEIFISGIFALLKILALSSGPLILEAFIMVSEGKEAFRYEGYVLAILLFLAKCLESLSQRQWYFRSRVIGLQVRSLLLASIYKKQLRLSNAAKLVHSAAEIMNYVIVDAYRIGEFPYWFHQTWTTSLQLCITLLILFRAIGMATFATLVVIILTVLCNAPLAKLHQNSQTKLMAAQDERLKATTEALVNMKVLKLYAWETHFKNVVDELRKKEYKFLSEVQLQKAYYSILFWTSPVLVSAATFGTCYLLGIPLNASNVFTFVATFRLVQDPIRAIPDVIGVAIQAKVALRRIVKFLEAPELQNGYVRQHCSRENLKHSIFITSANFSWDANPSNPALRNTNLEVKHGEKVAICGEVGSGKSTLLSAILGEVPNTGGAIQVCGKIAYVSQTAWIQTGTIQENILFGSTMNTRKYQEVLEKCSLERDLESLPFGDLTEIGERGVNLSGGQKQRIQLARALYQDADVYLLDDPFSAVDAHTAKSLFNEFIMGALSGKTVILVTHQVDFLPAFDSVLLMSDGEILSAAPYHQLLASSEKFQGLVNAHKDTAGSKSFSEVFSPQRSLTSTRVIKEKTCTQNGLNASVGDQLIRQEEKERGDTGFKPYIQYLNQNKGFLYYSLASLSYLTFLVGQILQNSWMAANVENPHVSKLQLINVYLLIGISSAFFLVLRSLFAVVLGLETSKSLFSQLLNSLFRASMSFYDSTPLGRILSRVSSDLSIVDLDVPFSLMFTASSSMNTYSSLGVLAVLTWQILFVSLPLVYLTIRLQVCLGMHWSRLSSIILLTETLPQNEILDRLPNPLYFFGCFTLKNLSEFYKEKSVGIMVMFFQLGYVWLIKYYFASAKELMRISGTTKSLVANHLAETIAGAMTIRAFEEEDRFFSKNMDLINGNASPFFHYFAANEWLIQRLEILGATVLSSSALAMALLPPGTFSSGFVGMALSYGLSLNISLVITVQNQCTLANYSVSVERLNQYMHIPSEAAEIVEGNQPEPNWPTVGKVEIHDLKIRYRPDSPLVLCGISCTFEGGHKIGIVGRTGSGKTTLISALFRLVEPAGGKIIIDGIDISTIGLHDLRSRLGIIPQDPTLFNGSVRYNLDPLSQHTDQEIWEVLGKCQLKEAVQDKKESLDSLVVEDGSNWSMGQRQLFCLGRALLRRSRILVLDEATASIDNVTDTILQKTIRTEFADCTVVTVAHRIPTVMDCTMVLAISEGKLAECDEPMKLMKKEGSIFGQLIKEYWSAENGIYTCN